MTAPKAINRLVDRVTTIAKRAAAANGIQYGIVQSRNPDGSLNVRPIGAAGCVRVVGKQNSRVGDKVPITNQPSIGSTTSLQEYDFNAPPSDLSCPEDPRTDPKTPPVTLTIPHETAFVSSQVGDWAKREDPGKDANATLPFPHSENYSVIGATGSFFKIGSDYDNQFGQIPPFGPGPYNCFRTFLGFDLSALDPNIIIDSVDISATCYSFQPASYSDKHVFAVRSLTDLPLIIPSYPGDFPIDKSIIPVIDKTATYGSLRINDYSAGSPVMWHIEGFPTTFPKTTLALIGEFDLDDTPPIHGGGTSSWLDELVIQRVSVSVSGSISESLL
jgi:hypothetical protein